MIKNTDNGVIMKEDFDRMTKNMFNFTFSENYFLGLSFLHDTCGKHGDCNLYMFG